MVEEQIYNMKLISVLNEVLNIGSEERIHVSEDPIQDLRDLTAQNGVPSDNRPIGKPDGFWYAFGDSWLYFTSHSMRDKYEGSQHAYKVVVDKSKIVSIRNQDMLNDFNREFAFETDNKFTPYLVDWSKVSQKYSGFEIPCYDDLEIKGSRYIIKNRWLYNWDIPSGVIWNPNAVLKLKPLGNPKTLKQPRKDY
jgi:hypothetical protein